MKRQIYISTLLSALGFCTHAQQLYASGDALIYIAQDASMELTGDLENDGTITNNGQISLYGDWSLNNLFFGDEGSLFLVGGQDQNILASEVSLGRLFVDVSGVALFTGQEFIVKDEIRFDNGVLMTGPDSRFALESDVQVMGGSTASYFQGRLSYQGGGIRRFPLGYEGVYAPITMLDVFGTGTELTAYFQRPNPEQPLPDNAMLGISSQGLWEVQLTAGSLDGTPVQIDFSEEDLENLGAFNNIRHRVRSPVIARSDAPGGVYTTLGVSELVNTDSVSEGSITGEIDLVLESQEIAYLAIGLAPRIDPAGLVYIPEIFSPAASDPDNQTFRVFGEFILRENFSMQVYNRFGSLVYSTDSFDEANQIGWDGTNQRTGNDEPSGLYYYQVVLTRRNGKLEEYTGPFYLQR